MPTLFVLMFVVFLTLKLAEVGVVAAWSWWWVTIPLWGPISLFVTLSFIVFLFVLLGNMLSMGKFEK